MKDLGRTLAPFLVLAALLGWLVPVLVHWRMLVPSIEIIEAEGFLLGILCLGFALRQYRDAREQASTLRDNTAILGEVREHISTKFLAVFPHNIPDLTQFISGAVYEFDIMVDFAGYGQYSAPEQFASYFSSLERCARHSAIRILAYGAGIARSAIRQQWPKDCLERETKESRFSRFLDDHQDLIRPLSSEEFAKQLTYDQFIELQLQVQMQSQNQLAKIRNVSIRNIDDAELVMIAWIRSDDHTIFSFKNRGTTLRELSFSTRDTALLHVFRDMFERLWRENDPRNKATNSH